MREGVLLIPTTFEEHMRPGVLWLEDPRFAEAWEELVRDPDDPVGKELARHDKRVRRY